MYDRGNLKQVFGSHQLVPPVRNSQLTNSMMAIDISLQEVYTGDEIKFPHPSEVPNLDLEIVNYHRPALGTFHAKWMVGEHSRCEKDRAEAWQSTESGRV
jgi:hypothetical protein